MFHTASLFIYKTKLTASLFIYKTKPTARSDIDIVTLVDSSSSSYDPL